MFATVILKGRVDIDAARKVGPLTGKLWLIRLLFYFKKGKLLLLYVQQGTRDLVPLVDILKAVGIDEEPPAEGATVPNAECNTVCKSEL